MKAIEQFQITGKVAIVTGATRGLGKEMAAALASGGADLVIASRSLEASDQVAEEITNEYGVKALGFAGDLSHPCVAGELVDAAIDRFGRVDIVVNNAGINIRGAIDEVTPEQYDEVMAVNVRAPWLLCRAVAPHFKKQLSGRVINVASALGVVAMADRSLYCTSKGALVHLTRELAVEWASYNVTVNAICPGPFETEMNRVLTQDPEKYQQFANFTAMKRWGKMHEIGPTVLYLASDAASYVTGAVLPIDGGWVAW